MEEVIEKILIVDDDFISQAILDTRSTSTGLETHIFSDAESGWGFFVQETPRLVVLDWNLPGMTGIELCRKIRETAVGQYVAILIISVRDQSEDFEEALNAGADFFMTKPLHGKFFDAWLAAARKNVRILHEMEKNDVQVERYKQEVDDVNEQLEDMINRANQMAQEAEQAYVEINQIFKAVTGGIILVDLDCNIMRHNEFFLEIIGGSLEDATSRKCYEVFNSELCKTDNCPMLRIKNGEDQIRSRITKKDSEGNDAHFSVVATPFRGLVGELVGVVEHITDITKRVQAEEALKDSEKRYRQLSTVDELTGLFNKRYLNNYLGSEISRVERHGQLLSLIIMDIDNFKHHNDTYGHADGDKVLARLGELITEHVRSCDQACRYGGEEFVIVLPSTAGEGSVMLGERIRVAFAEEGFYPTPDEKVTKTLSLGITQYVPGDNIESFIKRADANLYAAKRQGKNRTILK